METGQSHHQASHDDERTISEKKRAALDLMLDAWENGLESGIDNEILAHAALFSALSDMIDIYGEEAVSQFTGRLPQRIMKGEFTLVRHIQ